MRSALFQKPLLRLLHQFEEAKNCGSLIQPCLDESAITEARRAIEAKDPGDQLFLRETHRKVLRVLEQAEALTQRYHVVVANPPYMGGRQMNPITKRFAEASFPNSKADLFAMFIERGFTLVVPSGFTAFVTMQSWMFLSVFEDLRIKLLDERTILTATQMGNMVMGIAFGTVATVWRSIADPQFQGSFSWIELKDLDENGIPKLFPLQNEKFKRASSLQFSSIPGSPIAYWITDGVRAAFREHKSVGAHFVVRGGMTTGDNLRFLRLWYEVASDRIGFDLISRDAARASKKRWFPYNKGGEFRKWFGNNSFVVNWARDGEEILATGRASPRSKELYFKPSISWTDVTSGEFGIRESPGGYLFDASGPSIFNDDPNLLRGLLGLLCSIVASRLLKLLNPSIHVQAGDISRLPWNPSLVSDPGIARIDEAVTFAFPD